MSPPPSPLLPARHCLAPPGRNPATRHFRPFGPLSPSSSLPPVPALYSHAAPCGFQAHRLKAIIERRALPLPAALRGPADASAPPSPPSRLMREARNFYERLLSAFCLCEFHEPAGRAVGEGEGAERMGRLVRTLSRQDRQRHPCAAAGFSAAACCDGSTHGQPKLDQGQHAAWARGEQANRYSAAARRDPAVGSFHAWRIHPAPWHSLLRIPRSSTCSWEPRAPCARRAVAGLL